ncbi:uncharacterized protein DUF3325 [Pseudoduganella lurida]|uniref:Uncharacterized protein DUF3325 n=1 Tax=Pseudoduganella lurida TaxID=1036180 RepID=A0A562QWK5_9BURK|nr:DUF3325 domain-containing protein [Pseudoduganella lurida]TWI61165.1 uncharacterized protein DUF3325 [Pseudoduganella lurida]
MTTALFIIAALAATAAGFAALALAIDRHWEAIHGRGSEPTATGRRNLRLLGSVALVLSLWCCLQVRSTGQAVVLWCGVLSVGAWLAVALFTYAARHAGRTLTVAGALACITGVAAVVLR